MHLPFKQVSMAAVGFFVCASVYSLFACFPKLPSQLQPKRTPYCKTLTLPSSPSLSPLPRHSGIGDMDADHAESLLRPQIEKYPNVSLVLPYLYNLWWISCQQRDKL